jgi:hypothetical protein
MTNNHTPTPWIVGKQHIHGIGNVVMQAKQTGPYKSLAICDGPDDPTNEANAGLIVLAVNSHADLLEALELSLEYWAHRQQRYKNRSPVWVQKARVAVAKAKGAAS